LAREGRPAGRPYGETCRSPKTWGVPHIEVVSIYRKAYVTDKGRGEDGGLRRGSAPCVRQARPERGIGYGEGAGVSLRLRDFSIVEFSPLREFPTRTSVQPEAPSLPLSFFLPLPVPDAANQRDFSVPAPARLPQRRIAVLLLRPANQHAPQRVNINPKRQADIHARKWPGWIVGKQPGFGLLANAFHAAALAEKPPLKTIDGVFKHGPHQRKIAIHFHHRGRAVMKLFGENYHWTQHMVLLELCGHHFLLPFL